MVDGTPRGRIARLNGDGSLDASFDPGAAVDGWVEAVAVQSDGKVLIGGVFFSIDGSYVHHGLIRLNADGSVDSGFRDDPPGWAGGVSSIELYGNEEILVAREYFGLSRLFSGNQVIQEDTGTGVITFSVSDIESGSGDLVVTAGSSNTALVDASGIVLGGTTENRTVEIMPIGNASGTTIVILTLTDPDGGSGNVTFTVTVDPVNDLPTLAAISDPVVIDEDAGVQTINLSGISAGGGESQTLALTVVSSNPGLIPDPVVSYGSPGTTGSLSYTPLADQSGSATITVTVSDAGLDGDPGTTGDNGTISQSFTVNVGTVNDLPTISAISNQVIDEDTGTGVITFSVSDVESGSGDLVVTAGSSNTGLVDASGIVLGGTTENRTVEITPIGNAWGTTSVTLTVTDPDGGSVNVTFTVTVDPVNDLPTLAAISDPAAIDEDAGAQTISLTGISAGGGESQTLAVTAVSGNPGLIPDPTVSYTSANTTGSLGYTPVANANGTATITVTVTDDGGTANGAVNTVSRTFTVTVTAVNDTPTLTAITDPTAILEDGGAQTINLTGISAGGGESQTLAVTVVSSNPGLIPDPTVSYTSPGTTGSLSYTPLADQSGSAIITVTVVDGGLDNDLNTSSDNATVTQTFTVTVDPVNDAPTLAAISDPAAIDEDAGTQTINLTGISAGGGENQTLTVSVVSSNTGLIPNPTVSYTSADTTGSLGYTPVANQFGSATITVTVSDAGLDGDPGTTGDNGVISQSFTVAVGTVNDLPTISAISNQVIQEDTGTGVITFSVSDVESSASDLVVTASSSNAALVSASGIVLGGTTENRTVEITPIGNASGTTIVTLTVTDPDGGSANVTFTVTVDPVNDAPTLTAISDPAAIAEDAGAQTINLTGISAGGGEGQTLAVTAVSSNTGLIPNPTVSYTSPGTTGGVSYTPLADQFGSAIITVTVSDAGLDGDPGTTGDNGTVSQSFTVAVGTVNDLPTISTISNQVIQEDTGTGAISFTVSDVETPVGDLEVTVESSNSGLVPVSGLELGGSGASRTLTVRPLADAFGTTTVTVNLTDLHSGMVTESFLVTVNAVNDAPSLNAIADPPPVFDTADPVTLLIEGIGAGAGEVQELRVLAVSSNPDIVPDPVVNYRTPDSAGTLTYAPVPGKTGTSTITVSVIDSGLDGNLDTSEDNGRTTRTFLVTVEPLPVGNLKLSGTISYYSGNQAVPNVTLSLVGDLTDEVGTDASGSFEFAGLGSLARISVVPLGKTETRSSHGLTSLDLALIKRHILGVKALDTPQQLLAADVNGSGSITMMDVLILWREILALPELFPFGKWRFVPADYHFPDPEQPWDATALRLYPGIPSDLSGQDFLAIKLGDVDGSWKAVQDLGPGSLASVEFDQIQGVLHSQQTLDTVLAVRSPMSRSSPLRENDPGVTFEAGIVRPYDESVNPSRPDAFIPVTVANFSEVTSLQFTLQWDPSKYEFIGVGDFNLPGLDLSNFGRHLSSQGSLTILWFISDRTGVSLADGTALFTIHLKGLTEVGQTAVRISPEPMVREVSVRFEPSSFHVIDQKVDPVNLEGEKR
jgi:hypothetical protein